MEILTLHKRDMAAGIFLGSLACFMPLDSVMPFDILLSVQLELLCLDQIKDTYCLKFYLFIGQLFRLFFLVPLD